MQLLPLRLKECLAPCVWMCGGGEMSPHSLLLILACSWSPGSVGWADEVDVQREALTSSIKVSPTLPVYIQPLPGIKIVSFK